MNSSKDFDNNEEYYVINLRDIFTPLWKGKYIIIGVTLISMVLAALVSTYYIDPVYEATVNVIKHAAPTEGKNSNMAYLVNGKDYDTFDNSRRISDTVDIIINKEQANNLNYIVYLNNSYVLQNTIKKLGLSITPDQLKGQIRMETRKDIANMFTVIIGDANPSRAASIANTITKEANRYITISNNREMEKIVKRLETQKLAAQSDLDKAIENFTTYKTCESSVENEVMLNSLQNDIERRKNVVDTLSSKVLEVKTLMALNYGEDNFEIVSAAAIPQNPAKPNQKANVVIAGILGLMVSSVGVFALNIVKKQVN